MQTDLNKPVFLSKQELRELLQRVDILEEEDTYFSDKIRILKDGNEYFIQEMTPKNEVIIRRFRSFQQAKKLLTNRLSLYEKMWNGCGCKINYYQ